MAAEAVDRRWSKIARLRHASCRSSRCDAVSIISRPSFMRTAAPRRDVSPIGHLIRHLTYRSAPSVEQLGAAPLHSAFSVNAAP